MLLLRNLQHYTVKLLADDALLIDFLEIARMRLQRILSAGLVLATIALPASAWAAQTTTTFPVNATVLKACVVTANPLNFGSYDPTARKPWESES